MMGWTCNSDGKAGNAFRILERNLLEDADGKITLK
jgi:hypothetical protein